MELLVPELKEGMLGPFKGVKSGGPGVEGLVPPRELVVTDKELCPLFGEIAGEDSVPLDWELAKERLVLDANIESGRIGIEEVDRMAELLVTDGRTIEVHLWAELLIVTV